MPKFKNPPQGGEKYLCLTLFCTMMLSVVSAVAIIYSIVIIYLPSKMVLESNITGPAMCTTLSMERNIDSIEFCHNWSSCEEWCLSKVNQTTKKSLRILDLHTVWFSWKLFQALMRLLAFWVIRVLFKAYAFMACAFMACALMTCAFMACAFMTCTFMTSACIAYASSTGAFEYKCSFKIVNSERRDLWKACTLKGVCS